MGEKRPIDYLVICDPNHYWKRTAADVDDYKNGLRFSERNDGSYRIRFPKEEEPDFDMEGTYAIASDDEQIDDYLPGINRIVRCNGEITNVYRSYSTCLRLTVEGGGDAA